MGSGTPIVRQVSWLAALRQLAALAAAVAIAYAVGGREAAPWGAIVYLVYSIGSRQLIARAHRAGVGLLKQQRFADAKRGWPRLLVNRGRAAMRGGS